MGACAMLKNFVKLGVEKTLQYDPNEDKMQNAETYPILDEEPVVTPKWGDQYINADILLPRGAQNDQRLSDMPEA